METLFKKCGSKKFYYSEEKDNKLILDDEGITELFESLKVDFENPVIGHIMINIMEMQRAEEAEKYHVYNLLKNTRTKSFAELAMKIPDL